MKASQFSDAAITQAQPAYDARGNLTGLGASAYGYDVLNRLTSATPAGGTIVTMIAMLPSRSRR
ncbi:MAG: RHS repeat protein [Hyphomonadaceae bacterium]|nr:RHS repeat protein [Hyphomonadaceae bacterium]